MSRCEWCWSHQDVLSYTVTGDEQSPALCDSCTDGWDSGFRKFVHMMRAS